MHPRLRRALFLLHQWLGVGFGLYLLIISVSGSAVILRPEFHRWFEPGFFTAGMEWLVALHDHLFLQRTGRLINGVGGALLTLMVISGLPLWWPRRGRWRNALLYRPARPWLFQLHAVTGFWAAFLLLAWGITGIYFAFPGPFDALIDLLDDDLLDFERPEGFLLLLIDLHFGRFGGLAGRLAWMLVGLLPAMIFITGLCLWLRRLKR